MSSYSFGERSKKNLSTCIPDLVLVAEEALKYSAVDFGISQGARSVEKQLEYYRTGKSKVNPNKYQNKKELLNKGKHLVDAKLAPLSRAFDFYVYIPGKPELAYDIHHIMYVSGVIDSAARRLYEKGLIQSPVRLGSNWDRDGIVKYDQSFFDAPHVESLYFV